MHMDWQTLVAGLVVAITLLVFLVRLARPGPRGSGCGSHCGWCKPKKPEKPKKPDAPARNRK